MAWMNVALIHTPFPKNNRAPYAVFTNVSRLRRNLPSIACLFFLTVHDFVLHAAHHALCRYSAAIGTVQSALSLPVLSTGTNSGRAKQCIEAVFSRCAYGILCRDAPQG
jgi:hypothetical protein